MPGDPRPSLWTSATRAPGVASQTTADADLGARLEHDLGRGCTVEPDAVLAAEIAEQPLGPLAHQAGV
jgi:hypothetical protein